MRLKMRHGGPVGKAQTPEVVRRSGTAEFAEAALAGTPFDYMFGDLTNDPHAHLPVDDTAATIGHLKDLGDRMVDNDPPDTINSSVPPVYTYWGQFIDHDITANTDRNSTVSDITPADFAPVDPDIVKTELLNLRSPAFDLDSVYGGGPAENPEMYDGIKLKIGTVSGEPGGPVPGVFPPPDGDRERDLPRGEDGNPRAPVIGDSRNDENLIVAQFHLAFLRFHNAAVDWVKSQSDSYRSDDDVFAEAQKLTRLHYQWLVIQDYLPTVTAHGTVDKVLQGGRKFYNPAGDAFAPIEFSVAAYRFGHSMVRDAYDHNRNFGRGAEVVPRGDFAEMFRFTGNGGFRGLETLPFNWIIEWDRFVDHGSSFDDDAADDSPSRFARKIDTHLAPPLADMQNEVNPSDPVPVQELLKHLAQRNLLRGYLLSVPTGQAVADEMGITALSTDELQQGNSAALNQTLSDGGFLTKTPLWYYVLKEAEVRENGEALGDVGSRIVVETMIGMMECDEHSYLRIGWEPAEGVRLANGDPIVTIGDFLKFAGVLA